MALLAAGPHAEAEVGADGVDGAQHVRAVPDESRVPQRLRDLAVPDPVRLRAVEDEVAGRHIDLAPSHPADVDPVLDAREDLGGDGLAGEDHGRPHPGKRKMPVRFPAAVPGGGDLELPRGLPAVEEPAEDPPLDQDDA